MGTMQTELFLHPDRLFPAEESVRSVARRIYAEIKALPIISPHGHTDPWWFALNENFTDPVSLLLQPDHYVLRMLYSQGITLEEMGISPLHPAPNFPLSGGATTPVEWDKRKIWRKFAENYYLFRGTPSRMWLDHVFSTVFGLEKRLGPETADLYFDKINDALKTDAFKPRALFERFNIELISTTDGSIDPLEAHQKLRADGWGKKVIPCFRPDDAIDPDHENFRMTVAELGRLTNEGVATFDSYLRALRARRAYYKKMGATATDHGPPSAFTTVLAKADMEKLFAKALATGLTVVEAEHYRGHMLVEMARMSLDDGLVMQIHPGSYRNHNAKLFTLFGRDKGADIPRSIDYTSALRPLLNELGNEASFRLIVFTLDETSYARELAPLAGHYPALKVGPAWWFHDSPEGMRRYREQITETAGFYNTVGFNDDTRAFFSIPARHDVCRRMDSGILAKWVCEHRMTEDEATLVARDLTYNLVKQNYNL
jgi:glucuronate isomerase